MELRGQVDGPKLRILFGKLVPGRYICMFLKVVPYKEVFLPERKMCKLVAQAQGQKRERSAT